MEKEKYIAYVGTYTHGSSIGIHLYDVNVEEGTLSERKVVPVNNSSYVVKSKNGKYLYSIADEGVAVFEIKPDGDLELINKVGIDGMRGCYLCVDDSGKYLFVAGYHDGKITAVHTHQDGRLGQVFDGVFHKGVGSVAERNFRPHVSCVKTTPEGKYVCAVDNGIDQVKVYRINTARNRMELVDILRCKRESGPREILFSKDGKYAYILFELINKVGVFTYKDNNDFDTEFFTKIINDLEIKPVINTELPIGVTAQMRTDGENDYVFVMNFSEENNTVVLDDNKYVDMLTNEEVSGELKLNKYGVKVLKRQQKIIYTLNEVLRLVLKGMLTLFL